MKYEIDGYWLKETPEISMCLYNNMFGVLVKHRVKRVVFLEVCYSEVPLWMHREINWTGRIMRNRSIKG